MNKFTLLIIIISLMLSFSFANYDEYDTSKRKGTIVFRIGSHFGNYFKSSLHVNGKKILVQATLPPKVTSRKIPVGHLHTISVEDIL